MKWSTKLPKVRLTNILKHEGVVKEAVFSKDETRILTWSFDRTARLWDVPGDLDFPQEYFSLQVEALTGTRFDPITRQIRCLPPDEFNEIQKKWLEIASEHAKVCKYPRQNMYLRLCPEARKK